jgi:hypothetical protein
VLCRFRDAKRARAPADVARGPGQCCQSPLAPVEELVETLTSRSEASSVPARQTASSIVSSRPRLMSLSAARRCAPGRRYQNYGSGRSFRQLFD